MSAPTVFLSAATVDLEAWRNLLHQAFSRAGFHVYTQNQSLGAAPGDVSRLLTTHIDESQCVIHLAGMGYGADADPMFEEAPHFQCSWTQFEYYYAHHRGMDVIAFVCAPELSKAGFVEQGRDAADIVRKQHLQKEHRARVESGKFDGTPLTEKVRRTSNERVNSVQGLLRAVAAAVGTLHKLDRQARSQAQVRLNDLASSVARIETGVDSANDKLDQILALVRDRTAPAPIVVHQQHGSIFSTGPINVFQPPSSVTAEELHDLQLLADKVESQWIDGYLNRSLHGTILVAYRAQTRDDLVDNPWFRTLERPNAEPRDLPPGVPLLEVFEDCGRTLLILGDPGGGKTITLLMLCRELLDEARTDSSNAVPVVFNLSSWAGRRLNLGDWLVEELRERYRVPSATGRAWVEKRRLLPLLDGLDEVIADARPACVETIRNFETLCGLVVCCRRADYEGLPVYLNFNAAICLQPFTPEQVNAYLDSLGEGARGLREAVSKEPELGQLAANPLMLSIMCLAFQGDATVVQKIAAEADRVGAIFNQYIHVMFRRRPAAAKTCSQELTIRWLTAVAHQMQAHGQSTLLVEQIQPTWLPRGGWRWTYVIITRLIPAVIIGTGFVFDNVSSLPPPTIGSLHAACAVVGSLAVPEIILLGLALNDSKKRLNWSFATVFNLRVVFSGLSLAVYLALEVGAKEKVPQFPDDLGMWLFSVFMGGASSAAWCYAQPWEDGMAGARFDVRTIQNLQWRFHAALRAMFGFGICIFCVAMAVGGFVGVYGPFWETEISAGDFMSSGWAVAWIWGLVGAVAGFIIGGFQGRIKAGASQPNEGITSSLVHALAAAGSGLMMGLTAGLVLAKDDYKLVALLAYVVAALFALRYGGQAVIRHYVLRALLAVRRQLPLRLVRFLEHARNLIFMQRAGGSYLFLHRLLLEHFAHGKLSAPK